MKIDEEYLRILKAERNDRFEKFDKFITERPREYMSEEAEKQRKAIYALNKEINDLEEGVDL